MRNRLNITNVTDKMQVLGLAQAEVARKLGVSREAVSKWLRNEAYPRPAKLLKLARLLDMGFSDLVVVTPSVNEPVVLCRMTRGRKRSPEYHDKASATDACCNCMKKLRAIKSTPYRYAESGLNSVILHGINQFECTACGEKAAEIPRVEELHFVISKILVCKKTLLSGCEIRFLRKEMGLKSNVLAKILSIDPATLSRWENAMGPVDESSDKLLRVIYMSWASEQRNVVLFQNLLKLEPIIHHGHASKRIPQPAKIELTAAEWTVPTPGPAFAPANC